MSSEKVVRNIKRNTRKKYSSEEKIRIVLEGLRGEISIAELCRKEGIFPKNIECKPTLELILKSKDNSPACVKPLTAKKLVEQGWVTS